MVLLIEKTDSLRARYEWLRPTARRTRRLVLFCSGCSIYRRYPRTMPSVALRFRSILEPKLPGDKSKASSMGSLSSSLPLLLRYSSYCYYSTLSTSAYLAPSVVSCSLGPFLRRQFSNPMSRVRLYRHLCSLGISFDTYSCTSRSPLRRLTTLCTRMSRIQSLRTWGNLPVLTRKSSSFVR